MHVVCVLGRLHRLLVSIRYMDELTTTPVLDMGVRALRIIEFVGVSGGFG